MSLPYRPSEASYYDWAIHFFVMGVAEPYKQMRDGHEQSMYYFLFLEVSGVPEGVYE